MTALVSIILAILLVEYFARSALVARAAMLLSVTQKSFRVFQSSRISDHWKERATLRYAGLSAVHTGWLSAILTGAAGIVAIPIYLLDSIFELHPSTEEYLLSPTGLTLATVVAVAYALVRKRLGFVKL